jgi:hypothetical protein
VKNRHGLGVLEREVDSVEDYSMNFHLHGKRRYNAKRVKVNPCAAMRRREGSKILHN